jgi:polyhydroxybutyrate depolymerase
VKSHRKTILLKGQFMKLLGYLSSALLFVGVCGPICFAGTNVNGAITFGGKAHDYILHVSSKYKNGQPSSLIISLHGYTFQPSTFMNVDSLWKTSDTAGFLVVYPHGTNNSWNSGPYCCGNNTNDDVGLMLALIDTLAAHYSLDRNRIYATGCSNGAMMANRLAAEKADVFAAIVGVAGPLALSATDSELKPARPISIMDFHALTDEGVPYNGGFGGGAPAETLAMAKWASANGCDLGPTITKYDNLTTVKTWKKSNSPVEVILYATQDGKHWWPPAHVPANTIIWSFFQRHPLNEGATAVMCKPAVCIRTSHGVIRTEYYDLRGKRLVAGISATPFIFIESAVDAHGESNSLSCQWRSRRFP